MSNISINREVVYVNNHAYILVGEIQSTYGFFNFYFSNLGLYPDKHTCFDFCNSYFKNQFGYLRYNSYESFSGKLSGKKLIGKENSLLINSQDALEREFLQTRFKQILG